MNPSDHGALAALVTDVMKYYRQDVSAFLLDTWVRACEPYSLVLVRKALTDHVRDPERGQFAPKVADVVRRLSGTRTDRSVVAWGVVYDAMGRVGAYQDVVFDDAIVHVVVNDMGGWAKLCRTEEKDLSYAQHRFMELYRSFAERGLQTWPRMLPGDRAADTEFERKGLPPPAPVLVGDPSQCAEVYTGGGMPRAKVTALPAGTNVASLAGGALPWQVKRLGVE